MSLAPSLDQLKDFIEEKIVAERWTHSQLNQYLIKKWPMSRGFSVRSLERFCSKHNIHKTSRATDSAITHAASTAVKKVSCCSSKSHFCCLY